ERRLEDRSRGLLLGLAKRLTAQQIASVAVGDSERMAALAVAHLEVTLEVGAPDGVRPVVAEERLAVRRAPAPRRPPRPDQAVAGENLSHRARRRKLQSRVRGGQRRQQLLRSPEGVALSRLDDDAHYLLADRPRVGVRPARMLRQPFHAVARV